MDAGLFDDLGPVPRGDVAAVTPLPDGYGLLADVGGHCFRVAVPDGVNRCKL